MTHPSRRADFYGNTVMHAAFTIGVFGWGLGYYGPPVFLHEVIARTAWPLTVVSSAVSFHFIAGAVLVIAIPKMHHQWGVPLVTTAAAISLGVGILGWAFAATFWQLYVAAFLTGSSWVALGAAGVNAIIAPWFSRDRPRALTAAYNGASIGGLVFTPLWGLLSRAFGFQNASLMLSTLLAIVIAWISATVLVHTPQSKGQHVDGEDARAPIGKIPQGKGTLSYADLLKNKAFLSLATAMALGLFAQIGLIAHLYSLLITSMREHAAGWVTGTAVGMGMAGRAVTSRALNAGANRRYSLAASYALQSLGTVLIMVALGNNNLLVIAGAWVFGLGIGNSSSLPPLIAQTDFADGDVQRVIALCIAFAQVTYAFAPTLFSLMLQQGHAGDPPIDTALYFASIALIQIMAALCICHGITHTVRVRADQDD